MCWFIQARLKPFITQPDAHELLHPIFVPLDLVGHLNVFFIVFTMLLLLLLLLISLSFSPFFLQMVKTTGGPELGASVVSPAMTTGAISLLQEHLTNDEKGLWTSLGPNWTLPRSVCLYMHLQVLKMVLYCLAVNHHRSLSQLTAQRVCFSVLAHVPGWVAA